MDNLKRTIPACVSGWTHQYFHQSAFDIPWKFPSQRVIKFLSNFKKDKKIKLFRGINKFNEESFEISSWTYSKKIAEGYVNGEGTVIEKIFRPEEIVLDTTLLNEEEQIMLGYDYKVDDKEVLVFN